MKVVTYEDEDGWLRQSMIKDNMHISEGPKGIPNNPPDISQLDWTQIQKELNRLMIKRKLISMKDLQGGGHRLLENAVMLAVLKPIVELYKKEASYG